MSKKEYSVNAKCQSILAREALIDVIENTSFGEFVKSIREYDEISQTELAKRMKVTRQFINAIELGKSSLNVQLASKIAEAFGYPREAFIEILINDMLKKAGINKVVEFKENLAVPIKVQKITQNKLIQFSWAVSEGDYDAKTGEMPHSGDYEKI
jgi:transcriptional regulator with XRE-family HTH domain